MDGSVPNRGLLTGRFAGIDPGLRVTGYSVLEVQNGRLRICEAGVIRVDPRPTLAERLTELYDGIRQVLEDEAIESVGLEQVFSHYERPKTAVLMGHARGVICLAAGLRSLPITDYAPTRVKRLLTGSGRATKEQIQAAICREFGLSKPPEPNDVADALAIATCHYYAQGGLAMAGSHPAPSAT
jgi:crossover junction endodeoxyribonuclease RuvC